MIAEILATGDEIRSGSLIDSNSAYIAQRLEEAGLQVIRHNCVGDDINEIEAVLKEIGSRADIAVVTGGLGPTTDDLTTEAAARAAGVDLVINQKALENVEGFFRKRKYPMSDSNLKQALLPRDSECLFNPVGSAPGFLITIGKCRFFFLPGVPYEMRRMISDAVLPHIAIFQGTDRAYCKVQTISTFGLPESVTGERLEALSKEFPIIRLGLRASFPEIQVKLYGNSKDEAELDNSLRQAALWVSEKLENKVVSLNGDPMEVVVGNLLRQEHATIAVAESCTGGLISSRITDVPGSSDYFLFSAITYSNEAKIKVLGVSSDTIQQYGAVHEETAKEMAEGVRRLAGSTYGLSVTGIAGPDGGTDEKPVGTVCIGLAAPDSTQTLHRVFTFGVRSMNKSIFAMTALDMLRRKLKGFKI